MYFFPKYQFETFKLFHRSIANYLEINIPENTVYLSINYL